MYDIYVIYDHRSYIYDLYKDQIGVFNISS